MKREDLRVGNRAKILSIYNAKDLANFPKYGDFLVRYSDYRGMLIVEIFKDFDQDGYIECLSWWNFPSKRGNIIPEEGISYKLGNGYDTYKVIWL